MKVLCGISLSDDKEIVIEMILHPSSASSKIALIPGQYMVCFVHKQFLSTPVDFIVLN